MRYVSVMDTAMTAVMHNVLMSNVCLVVSMMTMMVDVMNTIPSMIEMNSCLTCAGTDMDMTNTVVVNTIPTPPIGEMGIDTIRIT
jgi:hypothetical protein